MFSSQVPSDVMALPPPQRLEALDNRIAKVKFLLENEEIIMDRLNKLPLTVCVVFSLLSFMAWRTLPGRIVPSYQISDNLTSACQPRQDRSTRFVNEVREQKELVKYNIEKLNQSLMDHRETRDGAIISQYVYCYISYHWHFCCILSSLLRCPLVYRRPYHCY